MNVRNTTATAAAMAFALAATAANAQTTNLTSPLPNLSGAPRLSLSSPTHSDNHLLLLVSAIVLIVGLIDDDRTLEVLGGVGIIISLVESGGIGYYRPSARHGLDLIRTGPMSLGLKPFTPMGPMQGFNDQRPSVYLQLSSKF